MKTYKKILIGGVVFIFGLFILNEYLRMVMIADINLAYKNGLIEIEANNEAREMRDALMRLVAGKEEYTERECEAYPTDVCHKLQKLNTTLEESFNFWQDRVIERANK